MEFERGINYYELDGMNVVHHSNYIRYMEEARIYLLDKMGLPYKKIEDNGIMIPVLEVNYKYKYPAKFGDIIVVKVDISKFDGIKLITIAACGGIAFISGDILVAYFLSIAGALLCKYVFVKKTPVDIILIPLVSLLVAFLIQLVIKDPIKYVMTGLENFIETASTKAPFTIGILVSVIMGMALTAPISSAAIAIAISLSGIAGGAAVVGCCTQMLGFAVMSRKDNNIGMVVSVGIGTSMLQFKNILKKPVIWLPTIVVSAILGPLSTLVFKLECSPTGSGMGTSGLVGVIETFDVMFAKGLDSNTLWIVGVILLEIVLPIVLVYGLDVLFRKLNIIKDGDLKI